MLLMSRLAAAACLAAALAAPAFAQTTTPTALNGQINLGDVTGFINVVVRDNAQGGHAVATAAGNAVSGANLVGGLNAESDQRTYGIARSTAVLEGGDMPEASAQSTAQGNTLQAQTVDGTLSLTAAQFAYADTYAVTRADIGNARTLAAASSAASNNAATAAEYGDIDLNLFQQSTSSATAYTDVDACCTGQTVAGASSAINAWSSSSTTSTVMAQYEQESYGARSEATTDVYQNQAYDVTAATTAAANSATMVNEWGYANLRGRQTSHTDVRADTRVTLPDFADYVAISSYGVGNATLATNVGSDMVIDLEQVNTGGVDSNAQFTGTSSNEGDVVLATTAIGNAFTGYVCSECGDAALTGNVYQSNSGNIVSAGSITTSNSGVVIGSASAIGNSATFITTQRGN